MPEDEAEISNFDRAVLFDDAIYEVAGVIDGKLIDFEGTDPGLGISERLCALMDGTIAVESGPGKGSTFKVRLPVDMEQ